MGYPGYITFNAGFKDEIDTGRVAGVTSIATPAHRTIAVEDGESLASITERAYGSNTAANRDRIRRANANLSGTVRIPT